MTLLVRALAVLLVVVLVDALFGLGMYRKLVWGGAGAYCSLTNKTEFEKHDCAARVYYSRGLWLAITLALGGAAAFVAGAR